MRNLYKSRNLTIISQNNYFTGLGKETMKEKMKSIVIYYVTTYTLISYCSSAQDNVMKEFCDPKISDSTLEQIFGCVDYGNKFNEVR